MVMRVADYLVARLAQEGIDKVFGITGGGIMHLIDAITLSENVSLQPVHHEEFAGVCADGYARSGKRFGVVFATTGPGVAHVFASTVASWQDSVPVLVVVGQVKLEDSKRFRGLNVRQNGTFEFESIDVYSHVTKSAQLVTSANDAVKAIDEAINLCQRDRPGPVLIEIPLDVQAAEVDLEGSQKAILESSREWEYSSHEKALYSTIKEALSKSSRPILLLGAGLVRSHCDSLIDEFYSIAPIPYVVTQLARALGNVEHDLYLGSPGIKANRSANVGLVEADLIIAIGTSLHQQVIGWNQDAFKKLHSYKVWTELDPEVLSSRRDLVDEAFQVESSRAMEILIRCVKESPQWVRSLTTWLNRASILRAQFLLHYPLPDSEDGRLSLYRAISKLDEYASYFKSIVTDAGITWYVVPQNFFPRRGSFFISSGSFGSMGMALPLAIGSASATRERALCIIGDGSIMTCLQELATLASSHLPVVVVINSNSGYVSIRTTHDKYFDGRKIGTDFSNGVLIPRFEEVARTFGLDYSRVSTVQQMDHVISSYLKREDRSPFILEIMTLTNQAVEPVILSVFNRETGKMESGSLADLYPPLGEASE